MQPALGHMVHMPSHIDIRRGRWQAAIETNDKAIVADRNYAKTVPEQGFYRMYMAHPPVVSGFVSRLLMKHRKTLRDFEFFKKLYSQGLETSLA
jgi:hypothetical protein